MTAPVTVFGRSSCTDTARSVALLSRLGVQFEYRDVEANEEHASEARRISGGTAVPVIVLSSGDMLVEPTDEQLETSLHAASAD